ncbi:MAG TPA: hypothetical protein VM327_07570 [Candidatus Thermoplasmatota archaeon]|nr:hypothetical protein [Candidatus Thermoplasmatota archaeon]
MATGAVPAPRRPNVFRRRLLPLPGRQEQESAREARRAALRAAFHFHEGQVVHVAHAHDAGGGRRFHVHRGTERALAFAGELGTAWNLFDPKSTQTQESNPLNPAKIR